MRQILFVLVFAVPVVLAQTAERQVRYSSPRSALTGPSNRAAEEVGFNYLTNSSGISPDDLPSVYLAKEYTSAHNGVTHLVYRQRFQGIDVANSAWIANVERDGAVLNVGGTLYPAPAAIDFSNQLPAANAVRSAVREVNPRLA